MLREYLFAKIHRCTVTDCNPDYMGSLTIDPALLAATGIQVNERILVADCESGSRFETYVFSGQHGSGEIKVNGAAARLSAVGHHLLVMSFCQLTPEEALRHRPKVIVCGEDNSIERFLEYPPAEPMGPGQPATGPAVSQDRRPDGYHFAPR